MKFRCYGTERGHFLPDDKTEDFGCVERTHSEVTSHGFTQGTITRDKKRTTRQLFPRQTPDDKTLDSLLSFLKDQKDFPRWIPFRLYQIVVDTLYQSINYEAPTLLIQIIKTKRVTTLLHFSLPPSTPGFTCPLQLLTRFSVGPVILEPPLNSRHISSVIDVPTTKDRSLRKILTAPTD